jgi:uncharacterized protein (UPF0332 family)
MINFLDRLKEERKLELIEPSEQVSLSYQKKSRDCLSAAKLLFDGELYENAIGEAYYSMYNAIQSLFFKCGIKCENHSAAAVLLDRLFKVDNLAKSFTAAKKERIDKQYYTTQMQDRPVTEKAAESLIHVAETFILEVGAYKTQLKMHEIEKLRIEFQAI